jgi:hypothetical protein
MEVKIRIHLPNSWSGVWPPTGATAIPEGLFESLITTPQSGSPTDANIVAVEDGDYTCIFVNGFW